MKEIKFRAIDRKTHRMVYSEEIGITTFWSMWFQGELVSETIGQFIGRKDMNGTEVYEGDVVRTWGRIGRGFNENPLAVVEYSINTCRYLPYHLAVKCEILGNIHEKPELIKGVNK